jgi:hypothetical protein
MNFQVVLPRAERMYQPSATCSEEEEKKSPNLSGALINQLRKLGAPLSISKAKFYHLHSSPGFPPPPPPHIAWGSLSLFVCLPDLSSLPPHQGQQRYTHPSTHLGYGGLGVRPLASVWTFGDHPGSHTEVRIKHDFTSWLWRKLHQKVQLFQREGGGMLYRVAYKRKSRRA